MLFRSQGVAIASSVKKLRGVLEKTERDFQFGRMFYVDVVEGKTFGEDPDAMYDNGLLLKPHFLKRSEYKTEDEVRFVTTGREKSKQGGIILNGIVAQDWIQEIRLWPKLSPQEECSLKKIIEQYLPSVSCQRSDLMGAKNGVFDEGGPFKEGLETCEDERWRDGKDDIPPAAKEL